MCKSEGVRVHSCWKACALALALALALLPGRSERSVVLVGCVADGEVLLPRFCVEWWRAVHVLNLRSHVCAVQRKRSSTRTHIYAEGA